MDLEEIEIIKKLTVIAMFSDDDLMTSFVLKGGNAINIVHDIKLRSSIDLDFSMESQFNVKDLPIIQGKIEKALLGTFEPEGYYVFDVSFVERPAKVRLHMSDFWGGYQVEFKVISIQKYNELSGETEAIRRNAIPINFTQKRNIKIDISKFEYCAGKQERDLDGYTIFAYTPEMIVVEKIRAICQQMPEYAEIAEGVTRSARARDFFDIYTVIQQFNIDIGQPETTEMARKIFDAKRVPLKFIDKIREQREYHRADFEGLKDTVIDTDRGLRGFDFYFDYVIKECEKLKSLWVI